MVGPRRMNFSAQELDCFLDAVEEVMPLSATHWEAVAATHLARYPDTGRNVSSLKRKFKELHIKRVSTGDPHCPPAVRRAKRIKRAIVERMDGASLASLGSGDPDDEDQPPNLGGEVLGGEDLANVVDGLLRDDGDLLDDEAAAVDDDILAKPAAADGGQGRPLVRPPS